MVPAGARASTGPPFLRRCSATDGHEVRAAIRLTDELADWSEGIVRFAPVPAHRLAMKPTGIVTGSAEDPDRWLIYVVGDFDATAEYWREILAQLPATADPEHRTEAEEARDKAAEWTESPASQSQGGGDAKVWFKLETAWNPPAHSDRN